MVVNDLRRAVVGKLQRRRLLLLVVCAGLWSGILVGRLVHLQVALHEDLVERARSQQEFVAEIPAERGDILDREGRLLASSLDETSIYVHPHLLGDRDPGQVAEALAPALDMPREEVQRILALDVRFRYLARKARPEVVTAVRAVVRENGLHQAVGFHPASKRYYPKRQLAAHVLGYVSDDNAGQAGLEFFYDEQVRGQNGQWMTLKDGGNQPIDPDGLLRRDPTPGHDLMLTLDSVIQAAAESALESTILERGAESGSAIVMDPRSGAILAMATYPTFNPNVRDAAFASQWQNKAVLHAYEPGSTFKIFTAASALQEGVVDEEELIDCQGGVMRVASHTYHDWRRGFGIMPFREVLANSSNVGMIKVGLRFKPERFYGWMSAFGFGQLSGIDLPGEAPGILRATERWSSLSQSSMVIGQEVAVTPLQLITAVSAIANGGSLMEPYLVSSIRDADGQVVQQHSPRVRRRVVEPATARRLITVLERVVNGSDGSGTRASIPGYRIAGKTGTAQKIGPAGRYSQYVSSFIGMLPAADPELVVLVMIDSPDPSRGYYGSEVAMPAFRQIAETAIRVLRIPPDAAAPFVLADTGS
jgi:cell division protein FtsI (penicillin-binding protein 3)